MDELFRLGLEAWKAGTAYFRIKWPTEPLRRSEMSYEDAKKAYKAADERSRRARASGKHEKLAEHAKALDDAHRQFLAARLDPANEAIDSKWRQKDADRYQKSSRKRGKERMPTSLKRAKASISRAGLAPDASLSVVAPSTRQKAHDYSLPSTPVTLSLLDSMKEHDLW